MFKTELNIIGIDPSLRNFGLAIGKYNFETQEFSVHDLRLITSETEHLKRVRKNSEDLERARLLVTGTETIIKKEEISYAFVEVPHGSQSARAMASYGICIGILASLSVPIIQVTATENKVKATGHKTASKEEMINWAMKKFPNAPWLTRKVHGQLMPVEKNEHLADACGAINAGVLTDEWKNIVGNYLYYNKTN